MPSRHPHLNRLDLLSSKRTEGDIVSQHYPPRLADIDLREAVARELYEGFNGSPFPTKDTEETHHERQATYKHADAIIKLFKPSSLLSDLAEQVGRIRKPCPNKDTVKCVFPYADGCLSAPQGFVCHGTGSVPLGLEDRVNIVGMVKAMQKCTKRSCEDCSCRRDKCFIVQALNGLCVEDEK